MPPSVSSARWSVLIAAALFGTGGAAIKGTTLAPVQIAGFRSIVAVLALVVFIPAARHGFGRDLLPAALAYAAWHGWVGWIGMGLFGAGFVLYFLLPLVSSPR